MRKTSLLFVALLALPLASQAGRSSNVVIGSVLGAATGAVIGNNLGGRDGAVIGGALGAAAGVAIASDHSRSNYNSGSYSQYDNGDQNRYNDNRYRHDDRDDRSYRREVVESPRYYYQGNEFVYGSPSRYEGRRDNGRHRGWDRHRGEDHGHQVIIIQQPSRYDDGNYCPPPRRW